MKQLKLAEFHKQYVENSLETFCLAKMIVASMARVDILDFICL